MLNRLVSARSFRSRTLFQMLFTGSIILSFLLGPLVLPGFSAIELKSEAQVEDEVSPYQLVTACFTPDCNRDLKAWDLSEIGRLKRKISWEKDPSTGKKVRWEGVLLSQVIEKTLSELSFDALSLEHRAQIDLLILRGKSGEKAVVPRALASKYPILLALKWDQKGVPQDRGPILSIVPWTSKPQILNEELPLQRYFVPQLNRIELTNYRQLYSSFYLKRRTDPAAVRGEKLFVQNCAECHSLKSQDNPEKFKNFGDHPLISGAPNLKEKDRRSVWRYVEEYERERVVVPPSKPEGVLKAAQQFFSRVSRTQPNGG